MATISRVPSELEVLARIDEAGGFSAKCAFSSTQYNALCGDGVRYEMLEQIISCSKTGMNTDRPILFRFEVLGAALRLALRSPLEPQDLAWRMFVDDFSLACKVAEEIGRPIERFTNHHHLPCKKGAHGGLSPEESIIEALCGTARVEQTGLVPKVATVLWVHRGGREEDTRPVTLNKDAILAWAEEARRHDLCDRFLAHQEHIQKRKEDPALSERRTPLQGQCA